MDTHKEIKKKKDEEAAQIWTGVSPSATMCKTCLNALPDTDFTIGAEKAFCNAYKAPNGKPSEILCRGAKCDYYIPKEQQ